jgi:aldose 1-epimerase
VITLESGPARAVIAPEAGGRIVTLTVDGLELLVTEQHAFDVLGAPPGPFGWGMFPMAPWAGRIRRGRFDFAGRSYQLPINFPPHSIHGTIADRPADSARSSGGEAELTWVLGPPWPFAGRVSQRVALAADGLTLAMEILAEEAMPVTGGWHPWWPRHIDRGGPVELEFEPAAMYVRDTDGIPTGELVPVPPGPWDDCFPRPASPIRIRWPGAIEVTLNTGCDDVVVFTERPNAVCVEPQSGPPDAFNLGIHCTVLGPGETLSLWAAWRWRAC